MSYRYHVLGATRAVRQDGTEVPLSGARLRALLVALAAAGGRTVTTGRLAVQVWGEDEVPPADGTAALQALVGRLRRALGGEAVASAPGGYRLAVRPEAVDLFRFEQLAGEGTAALDADDPERAAGALDEALALWEGPALADLPGRGTEPTAVRAERLLTEARRARLAAEVGRGRPAHALAGLASLAAEQPLDEPLQALRIRALRAAGRPAEALQAYEDMRTLLVERLGTGPGHELRALHAELLAGEEPAPPAPAGRDAPGGFRPGPVRAPVRPSGRPSVREASAPAFPARPAGSGNLRTPLTSFVGREPELAALATELRTARLITLTGPGGAGKTRLSLEAAAASAGIWPDGVRVVELAPVHDAGAVPEAVLTALGARETVVRGPAAADEGPRDPLLRLTEHCGQRRTLIVLDNCEHLIDAAAVLAETLLTACPGVSVLATSREPLGVPGESVRVVDPLPQEAALRLFAERGAAARPGFRVDDDPGACAEICRRLDGLPLAVELAAARLRVLTPRQIADRLGDRFRLLGGGGSGGRTALPRQRTLRAVVDWSWDLLTEDERAVLRRMAVFSGGCALAEAESVCAGSAEDDTLGLLASLVDKSLVVAVPESADGMRYRLLETVAEYAAERLDASGERTAVERRHLTAYRELARTGDPELRGPRQDSWLRLFEREHDNIRAALRTAVDLREEQEALCLTLSMSWYWQLRDHQGDAHAWTAATAALGPDPFLPPVRPAGPVAEPCTALPPPWPEEWLWEARRGVRLMSLASTDTVGTELDRPDIRTQVRAITAAYRPGLPQLSRQPGSLWFFVKLMAGGFAGLGETVDALVHACREQWDGPTGQDTTTRGSRASWDPGLALMLRARLLSGRPDGLTRSVRDADEALALFEGTGDLVVIAETLAVRAGAYERLGRYAEAAADYQRAMESCARIGAPGQVPLFKARLASVRLEGAAGDPDAEESAERLLLDAVEEAGAGLGQPVSTARLLLARRYGRTGRTERARGQLRALEREPSFAEQTLLSGMVAGTHGWLDCLDGAFGRARDQVAAAVRRLDSLAYLVAPDLILSQFPCAAWAVARLGAPEDAARLLGAYDHHGRLPENTGFRPCPVAPDAENRVHAEASVRAALDGDTYARAHAEGAALPVKEAAALI
ncbi:BTAD domain-containing putative transcriptional regulator [Streptomyces sp. NPDC002018]|uniref:AfsR/SARP family transcriptional regulator n=1 Tax=Streptomyces sp. NPDC002018 TaxID=3364629 RepID=UPI0036CAA66F